MEEIQWKVEGMTCSNCAISVTKYLQKQGLEAVKVNPIDGAVSFKKNENILSAQLKKGIDSLGYHVVDDDAFPSAKKPLLFKDHKQRFLFCLPFTAVLLLHMLDKWVHIHWLMNPWIQLALCIPVFFIGMQFFGRSAIQSIRNGTPNMNVLVALGALASFIYSLTGAILDLGPHYLFFETTASIITLVFLGNYLEETSIARTQKAVNALASKQKVMANMIAFDDEHKEQIFPVENTSLKNGDLVLIKTGEQVPADCKILWGEASVNEAIITGESLPVSKQKKDFIIGGSILEAGTVKAQVTAAGKDSTLSAIVRMVQNAQAEKPPMQKLADKISAVFVPVVIGIAALAFVVNFFITGHDTGEALMRSIAVLVISCPCAMGLATPAAIAVGLGRGARSGILFRNASALESFKDIKQVVFDKTGTLTTGLFSIAAFKSFVDENEFRKIAYSLEKFSNHPLAKPITAAWQTESIRWKKVEEIKGMGIKALDDAGNVFIAGSFKTIIDKSDMGSHNVYISKNEELLGWIDVMDEIRPDAKHVIDWLHTKNIKTILLSGDTKEKCESVARQLNIDIVIAEQTPQQKLQAIEKLNAEQPTAMVGDGINDAPALAKATLGISLSKASDLAIQSADVILLNNGLKHLPDALGLGKHTFITIKQNLFWAFAYNIVAIPIAALGFLTPTVAALAMGFSDVVLAANSVRLFVKKVN
ncbi:MAG: cation-translocating P-type ATPase [Ferruginibacter sp.]